MNFMNRQDQLELLRALEKRYPNTVEPASIGHTRSDPAFVRTCAYLAEHGLIRAKLLTSGSGPSVALHASITAAGLDFLADDGGLTAVLGVVTVRLEAETLRSLIASRIDAAPLPTEEKSRLRAWLNTAGSEALAETTKRLVAAALDHAPDAVQLLQKLCG